MPAWWEMAYYCLDLRDGTVRHFPAGTYHEQAATREGMNELNAMQVTYNAWITFKTSAGKWTDFNRRVAALAMPEPKVDKPTRRLDWVINLIWGGSLWAGAVMRHLRGLSDG